MSFLDRVARAREVLEQHGRVSLSALKRELGLDDGALAALAEELVGVQGTATREGEVLVWAPPARAGAPAADGERRQLTVMFCDLVGSTELSRELDAEDLRTVIRAYQESAEQAITRYEGHVAQYLGDGILVYFGYPRAHEDDAERSGRAAREILTGLAELNERLELDHGLRLAVRIGIHTGPVVMGEMGGGGRRETLALGDTTNVAARLAGVADPDTVVMSEDTLRLAQGIFVTHDLGTPALKGIATPIHAYSVLQAAGVRSRLATTGGSLTPLVGRQRELDRLVEDWRNVREGRGRAALVCGDAGAGKTRLLRSFRSGLEGEPHGWLECRCSPHTRGSAFHPISELIEQGVGIQRSDDAEVRLSRLERAVGVSGLSVADAVPLLAPLLSLPPSDRYPRVQFGSELLRKRTLETLVAWTFGLAARQPLVMLIEDVHWCDPSTMEFLSLLLELNFQAGVHLLVTFRTEFEPAWPEYPHVAALALERLDDAGARSMVAAITSEVPLPEPVVARIVERSDGNPLFIEELTKMVMESELVEERRLYKVATPLREGDVPATLQDSLMARLDRLEQGKAVAQFASVLGREVPYEILRAAAPLDERALKYGLEKLVDAEILYRAGTGETAHYTFKHALIQETAYRSLLRSARREHHARVARVLEERFPERVAAEPERIARHCREAGLVEQAVGHYARAGERAIERSANPEAIGHLRRALDLLESQPASVQRDRTELELSMAIGAPLAAARGWADPDLERVYERARELASALEDSPDLPEVILSLSLTYYVKGDLSAAIELGNQALALAEPAGDPFHMLSAHLAAGQPLFFRGDFAGCLHHMQQAIELYEPAVHGPLAHKVGLDRGVVSRCFGGICLWALGSVDSSLALIEEAVDLARKVEHPTSLAVALFWLATVRHMRREADVVGDVAEELIALSEQRGFPLYVGLGKALRGWMVAVSGEAAAGVDEIQEGLTGIAQTSTGVGAIAALALLAEAHWRAGNHDAALAVFAIGLERSRPQAQHYYDAEVQRMRAEILLERDGDTGESGEDAPEALLRSALDLAREQGARVMELRVATSLARLLARRGRAEEGRALLAPIEAALTEGDEIADRVAAREVLRG